MAGFWNVLTGQVASPPSFFLEGSQGFEAAEAACCLSGSVWWGAPDVWREASLPRALWSGKQLWVIWGTRSRKLYQLACPKASEKTICWCSYASNCPIFRERHSFQGCALTKEQASSVPRKSQGTASHFHWFVLRLIFCIQSIQPPSKTFD